MPTARAPSQEDPPYLGSIPFPRVIPPLPGTPGADVVLGADFIKACRDNDVGLVLRLAASEHPAIITHGLNEALFCHHIDLARQLLRMGAEWDTGTVSNAAYSFEGVKLLFEFDYHVNTGLFYGDTLLTYVVSRNNEEAIRYLLAHGANPNLGPPRRQPRNLSHSRPAPNSYATLNSAASDCTPEIFALLLEHGAILSNSIALHSAAGWRGNSAPGGRIPMLEYLLGLGVDINGMDDPMRLANDGRGRSGSPLHYALEYSGDREVIKWLLEHGADPHLKTPWGGMSPRERAERFSPSDPEVLALLQQCPYGQP